MSGCTPAFPTFFYINGRIYLCKNNIRLFWKAKLLLVLLWVHTRKTFSYLCNNYKSTKTSFYLTREYDKSKKYYAILTQNKNNRKSSISVPLSKGISLTEDKHIARHISLNLHNTMWNFITVIPIWFMACLIWKSMTGPILLVLRTVFWIYTRKFCLTWRYMYTHELW